MSKNDDSFVKEITSKDEDFARWYVDVVRKAELADYSSIKGCMVIKPYGYELWENIKHTLDKEIKATGHKNAYFPLFVPESLLKKEADHIQGFAPLDGPDHVFRATGSGNAEQDITRSAEAVHLAGKHFIEAVVISHGGQNGRIRREGHGRIGPSFFLEPTHDLGGKVLGITGASPVAANHDLAAAEKALQKHDAHPLQGRFDGFQVLQALDMRVDHGIQHRLTISMAPKIAYTGSICSIFPLP
mgnify:CR=1 FL=1